MAKDLFSQHAARYAAFRPRYPHALYEFLLTLVAHRDRAWDCATGNGQVAAALAPFFQQVDATDISEPQLLQAPQLPNVVYRVAPAERSTFLPGAFDLITVGQAAHWFHLDLFYREVNRVTRPGGILAMWGYGLLQTEDADINRALNLFYTQVTGPYWEPERILIDTHYRTIPFPFGEIECPGFEMTLEWDIERLSGYLSTWSAVRKYLTIHAADPVTPWIGQIRARWGNGARKIWFPLFLRAGRVGRRL